LFLPVYEEEESNSRSMKYAAIFVQDWDLQELGYPTNNKSLMKTVLVESAVQKQVENKIQEATFFY
jgi:hypothetical protein